jgi:hypothetical protein
MIQLKAAPGYGAACVCFLINYSYTCPGIFLSQNKAAPCLWPAVVIGTQILCFRDNGFIFDYLILKYIELTRLDKLLGHLCFPLSAPGEGRGERSNKLNPNA